MSQLKYYSAQPSNAWTNNPLLVQLVGLSPAIAVSNTLASGLSLGICTLLVLILSSVAIRLLRSFIQAQWRFLWFLLVTAFFTTLLSILLEWFFLPLSKQLGLFLPLISCNFLILTRLEYQRTLSSIRPIIKDSAIAGVAYLMALVLLSTIRELLSYGSLFNNWYLLSPNFPGSSVILRQTSNGEFIEFASLLPAGFILLGVLVAIRNICEQRYKFSSYEHHEELQNIPRARVTAGL